MDVSPREIKIKNLQSCFIIYNHVQQYIVKSFRAVSSPPPCGSSIFDMKPHIAELGPQLSLEGPQLPHVPCPGERESSYSGVVASKSRHLNLTKSTIVSSPAP